ncbi:MAG: Sec-independent protein translocase protein TatB, partial [Janthinobacterium sp.]
MIDLGLSKIAIIGVVALIVIGPEKLPRVARMAGTLYGRAQRYLNQVKSEVSREIELEELKNLQKEVQDAAHSVKQSVEKSMHGVENSISGNLAEVENAWRGDSSAY